MLSRREAPVALEPADAHEERLRARTAAEPCGFEVEEHERGTRGSAAAHERRLMGRGAKTAGKLADGRSPVASRRCRASFDDEAAVEPFAVKDVQCDTGRPKGLHYSCP